MSANDLLNAYLYAIEVGFTQEAIAKHTGIPVESLRKFKQGESLGPKRRDTLKAWLEKHHLFLGARLSDPALIIAKELRTCADVMESGIDWETKALRLQSLLDAYGSGRPLRAAEESGEYGG